MSFLCRIILLPLLLCAMLNACKQNGLSERQLYIMSERKVYRAIGLMSGTSLDGVIDVALVETDGYDYVRPLKYYEHSYDIAVRDKVRKCFGKVDRDGCVDDAERLVTDLHIDAVKAMGESADIIGFHGQTITHDPDRGFTWQIGDGQRLARETGMDVVGEMRQKDIRSGGQGAPLLPLYHRAMVAHIDEPVMILNLGGVANITYVGAAGELIAFDCGPANALMDDFIKSRRDLDYDEGGIVAAQGQVQSNIIDRFVRDDYFKKLPPKSLDRNHWNLDCVRYASTEDGMATLMEMTIEGVTRALDHLPETPRHIYVAGGGRKNTYLLGCLRKAFDADVLPIDVLDQNGDATEAEGFAYLAVRSLLGEAITLPSTTGVMKPMVGGVLYKSV